MKEQFKQFLDEKRDLKNSSDNTLQYLEYCFKALSRSVPVCSDINLKTWFIKMPEAEQTIGSINAYARGINSLLSWCLKTATPQLI